MGRSSKILSNATAEDKPSVQAGSMSQVRKANHLKDEVYREMLRLEMNRAGAEMGLALALLRAAVQVESLSQEREFRDWVKAIYPMGLQMIEAALGTRCECDLSGR